MTPKLKPTQRIALIKRVIEKGEPVAKVCREVGISRVLFYRWLRRFKEEGREALEPRRADRRRLVPSKIFKKGIHLSPRKRLEMVKEVLEKGEPVSKIAREYGISRTLFYRLLKRYKEAPEEERLEALEPKKAYIERYFRQTPERFERSVLALVVKHPEYGVRRLVANLPQIAGVPIVGHHGVQNILWRAGLSTYEARAAWAAPQVTPVTRAIGEVTSYLSRFIALPVEVRTQVIRFVGITFVSAFLTIVILGIGGFWLTVVSGVPLTAQVGLVFASTALLMGSVFFLYSMKYYFTLAIVLSFSQQASPFAEASGNKGNGNGRRPGEASGPEGRRNGILSWILGLGNGGVKSRLGGITPQGPVGLEPSLEHVVLKRRPFISIHIPFYNEKNVAERILAAVTAFDWANYEVVVVDDSTDETTGIAKQFLKVNYGELRIIKDDEGTEIYKTPIINPNNPSSTLKNLPPITLIHRTSRAGFKGGALREALRVSDPKAEFVVVFDADFVPYPDTLELFLKYFQVTAGSLDFKKVTSDQWLVTSEGKQNKSTNHQPPITDHQIAAVQGYQWHVLNKSENWITRGVRSEYSGSYVIERSGTEILGALKMIAGSVYMVRRDLLDKFGWGTSITEDFQLTLRLYEAGYKVVYTPYIQAPAECVSTIKRLVRQRMRWAEGHSHNVRKMFVRLLLGSWKTDDGGQKTETEDRKQMTENQPSVIGLQNPSSAFSLQSSRSQSSRTWVPSPLTLMEKLEFLYLSPYYLQAFFFLVGTLSWLLAETLFPARLPFWTSLWGWSLVLTNFLSLPLMNAVGMFLEEAEERDYLGIISFFALSYILVPFQAYASLKGFLEKQEGPWFRTPKTGRITDIFTRGRFYRLIAGILPGKVLGTRVQGIVSSSLNPNAYTLNPNSYLSLATANSQFDSFKIRPKRIRWYGKLALIFVLTTSLLIHSLAFRAEPVEATWYSSSWQFRKQITIDYTKVSSGPHTDFPVLVNLASDTDLAADAQDDGDDILFTSSDMITKLSHEIESFNGTTGALVAWVKVPSLSSTANTVLYMYYGNASATNQQNATGVWDTNFKGVWHIKESGNGTADEFKDSTSNANHGQGGAGTITKVPTQTTGQIGYGQYFDGGDLIIDSAPTGLPNTNAVQTLSVWYKVDTDPGAFHNFLVLRNSAGGNANQMAIEGTGTTNQLQVTQWGGGVTVGTAWPTLGSWHMMAWTWDGTTNSLYKDGSLAATSTTALQAGASQQAIFASYDTIPSEALIGWMDETRVSNVLRSAQWIQTEFNNQNSPATFYSLGTEEEVPEFLVLLLPLAILAPALVKYFAGRKREWATEVVKN